MMTLKSMDLLTVISRFFYQRFVLTAQHISTYFLISALFWLPLAIDLRLNLNNCRKFFPCISGSNT